MRRYRNVPPLQFLLGFEAAARLGSFSKAAAELGLSQSAVSHQMRLLEERLGQPLFLRVGRSVQLTDAGHVYQRTVREALSDLDAAQQRLEPFRRKSSVVIYAPRDFGRLWLLPRIPALRDAHPDVQPWLDTSGAPIDFTSMEISLGIIYAHEPPPDLLSVKLVHDQKSPMVAPGGDLSTISDISALAGLPLIHDEKLPGWAQFFEDFGYGGSIQPSGLDFSDSDAALQAACSGMGIVLGSEVLAKSCLEKRQLVTVTDARLDPLRSWFAVTTDQELSNPHTEHVWNWLTGLAEAN